jgi:hypothetical protein
MPSREQRAAATLVVEIEDIRDRLAGLASNGLGSGHVRDEVERAVEDLGAAWERLDRDVAAGIGLSVDETARYLRLSPQTVRSWIERGALDVVAGAKPLQVDRRSVRAVRRALEELQARGRDRDWLSALSDYMHDLVDLKSPEVSRGLAEMDRGQWEPA